MRFGAIFTCVAASTISMSSSPRTPIDVVDLVGDRVRRESVVDLVVGEVSPSICPCSTSCFWLSFPSHRLTVLLPPPPRSVRGCEVVNPRAGAAYGIIVFTQSFVRLIIRSRRLGGCRLRSRRGVAFRVRARAASWTGTPVLEALLLRGLVSELCLWFPIAHVDSMLGT